MLSNPLFIPLVIVSVVALLGWLVVMGLVLGQRSLIALAFDSFPKEAAVEMVDRFYRHAQRTENPYDDVVARGAMGAVAQYDNIREAALGDSPQTYNANPDASAPDA